MLSAIGAMLATMVVVSASPQDPAELPETPEGLEEAPWEHLYVHGCKERLQTSGMHSYRWLKQDPVRKRSLRGHDDIFCHIPQAVLLSRGPTKMQYWGYAKTNCALALALVRLEEIAQEVGEEVFEREQPVKAMRHVGTYNCRRLRKFPDLQSQHSFGNAIDVTGFVVKRYGEVSVKLHWNTQLKSKSRHRRFLRTLIERLREEEVFSVILDPDYNRAHHGHFHLGLSWRPWFDMSKYTGQPQPGGEGSEQADTPPPEPTEGDTPTPLEPPGQ